MKHWVSVAATLEEVVAERYQTNLEHKDDDLYVDCPVFYDLKILFRPYPDITTLNAIENATLTSDNWGLAYLEMFKCKES